MSYTLRPLNLNTDGARYAELLSTVYPEPVTLQKLIDWERNFPKDGIRERKVAVDERGLILGYSNCGHMPFMLPDSYWVEVIVFLEYQRRGIGSHLYDDALTFARARGATRLEAEIRDHNPGWLRFAQARGFEIDRHVFESTLDLATFDESRFAGVIEAVPALGIRFLTFADAGDTEENRRNLYELNKRNSLDIPGSEGTFPRFEDFQRFVFEASWYRAEAQFIAADGERWVGMTAVGYFEKTNSMYTMHTGVLKEYRGRNIALALKLLSIRYARRWGAAYMRTNNDSKNAPILAINQKLGYQPKPGLYRCLKSLEK